MIQRSTRFATLLLPLTLGLGTPVSAAVYDIDASHSSIGFRVKHMMMSNVQGGFTKYRGTIEFNEKDPTKSTAELTVDVSSIDTREPKRDAHLKSPDFFDVAKYPEMTFKSRSAKKVGTNRYNLTGDLNLHGVTKEVVLAVELSPKDMKDPYGNLKRGANVTTKINRKDFGLTWNAPIEAGGVVVADEVAINIDLELTRRKDEAAAPAAVVPPPPTAQEKQVAQPKK